MAQKNHGNSNEPDDSMEADAAMDAGNDSDEEGGLRIDSEIYIPPPPKQRTETEIGGPRLMIDKIVNENFKSYAGKVTIGLFDECFSAIIGPNGSGKSNVIDSMLFVFGYRASKIRLKKISELIHNSSQHKDIRSCTVSVHFRRIIDKGNGTFEKVSNSDVVISRTAFKDNSSFYELNGKKVQLQTIAKLLRSEGVDLDHNRFLILQGEVEQIAMMKPKGQNEQDSGMLEFLEDIIGTTRYKEPLEKLSQNVELLTDRRIEKLNRLRLVEAEKDALKEPMQEALEYLKIENTIIKFQHELYHCEKYTVSADIVEHKAKKNELDADYANLMTEMQKVSEEKKLKSNEVKEKCKKWDVLQARKDKASAKYDHIRKQDEGLHAELIETNKRRKANAATLKTEMSNLEDLNKVPAKNEKDIIECKKLAEKSTELRQKEEETLKKLMEGLREKTEPLLKDRKEQETKLITLRKNVDQAKAAFSLAESELDIYMSVEETEKQKLQQLQETFRTTSHTLEQRKQQLVTLKSKIPIVTQNLKEAEAELESTKNREADSSAKLKNMRIQFEEKRSAMNASKSRNRVIDALMQEKRAGRMPGLFGRLGDLGAIDAKYDIAVSTACGALDNVVVDTLKTAQSCILFLRQHDIGRTTFIPLDKQERYVSQCQQKITTPENVPRLFDLIRVEDERVRPAFYYALRNTLVANDLNQATRIAYGSQRFRVVTLKGELIELSGTMSGGGKTALQGRMGQRVVRSEPSVTDIDALQTDLDTVYEECNQLRQRQQSLEEQIHTLRMALKDMIVDRDKCEIDIGGLTDQEPALRAQIETQKRKCAETVSSPGKTKALKKAVDVARNNYEQVKEQSKEIEDIVTRLTHEIEELSGGAVKEQQKKIAGLTKSIDKAEAEIRRLQVGIKAAQRNSKKTEQRIETLNNDVKMCETKIHEIQGQKLQFEEAAKEIIKELDELAEALSERDEIGNAHKEELNVLTTRESKMKALKIDLDQKIRDTDKAMNQLIAMVPEYERKIAGLKLHEVPGETTDKLDDLTDEQIQQLNAKDISGQLQKAKQRLPAKIPNMQVLQHYRVKEAAYLQRVAELDDITTERHKLRDLYDTAKRRRCDEFLAGFVIITSKLKQMYQMITLDGDAELELVDSMDPFSEGIVFSVRPPKKSWKNISNLSGGEKTLSSLALVFALHHYKPSPVYFMDEIDAALDFKNISIVGNYIKDRAKNSQFIIISLRDNMFELANTLVGIYKTYDATKSVTINMDKYADNHGGVPIVQYGATFKNRYCSQVSKSGTQITRKESVLTKTTETSEPQNSEFDPSEDTENPAPPSTANVSLGIGDLSLPPTPKKTPTRRQSSGSDAFEETSEKRPSRKRRRL